MSHLSTPPLGARSFRWAARLAMGCAIALGIVAPANARPAGESPGAAAAPLERVIVTARAGKLARAEAAVRRAGGRAGTRIPLARAVLAAVPASAVDALREDPAVGGVTADIPVQPAGDDAPAASGTTVDTVATVLGADGLVAGGHDGSGVDVALIDTGVAPAPIFDEAVIDGPDLSSTGGDEELRGLDAFGHGTHLAGILHGVAPGARILNVKVAEPDGATTLGRILVAIDWVVRNRGRDGLNVRVLNLAFGAPAEGTYHSDPLAYALERAQQRGIAVVVAAGNGGQEGTGLDSPAYDPHLIAVGADDDARTVPLTDDAVPAWSSRGADERNPDVIAPGTGIVSLGVPGGYLYEAFPGARVGEEEFRGSGTSQASAGVAALAALVLDARPELDPDELKAIIRATARPIPGATAAEQGAGVPDAAAAAAAPAPRLERAPERAKAGGQWRGRTRPVVEAAVGREGGDWSAGRWTGDRWSAGRWTAGRWTAGRWTAGRWTAGRWTAGRWTAGRWTAGRWTAGRWTTVAAEAPAP